MRGLKPGRVRNTRPDTAGNYAVPEFQNLNSGMVCAKLHKYCDAQIQDFEL